MPHITRAEEIYFKSWPPLLCLQGFLLRGHIYRRFDILIPSTCKHKIQNIQNVKCPTFYEINIIYEWDLVAKMETRNIEKFVLQKENSLQIYRN